MKVLEKEINEGSTVRGSGRHMVERIGKEVSEKRKDTFCFEVLKEGRENIYIRSRYFA